MIIVSIFKIQYYKTTNQIGRRIDATQIRETYTIYLSLPDLHRKWFRCVYFYKYVINSRSCTQLQRQCGAYYKLPLNSVKEEICIIVIVILETLNPVTFRFLLPQSPNVNRLTTFTCNRFYLCIEVQRMYPLHVTLMYTTQLVYK